MSAQPPRENGQRGRAAASTPSSAGARRRSGGASPRAPSPPPCVLVVLGTFFAWRQYDDAKDKALDDMRARVVLASTVFDTYFAGQIATLELDRQLRRPSSTRTRRGWRRTSSDVQKHEPGAQPTFTGGLGWIDRDGNSRVSDRFPKGSGSNVADRAYFKAVMATGKPYISEGLVTRVGQRRVVIMAVPTRDAAGKFSGVLIGALELRQSATSQRATDLGFSDLVLIDRAGQQLTLAELREAREHGACSPASARATACSATPPGSTATAAASSPTRTRSRPRWTIAFDRARSAVFASARRSFVIEMISILVAAVIVLAIVGWAIARSRREIAAEQEQIRRWDELAQSLGEASAAAEVSTALGDSLATAFPRAHVIVALQDDETGAASRRGRSAVATPAPSTGARLGSSRSLGSAICLARRSASPSPRPSEPSSRRSTRRSYRPPARSTRCRCTPPPGARSGR